MLRNSHSMHEVRVDAGDEKWVIRGYGRDVYQMRIVVAWWFGGVISGADR